MSKSLGRLQAEKGKSGARACAETAQASAVGKLLTVSYSFDFALQNEFSLKENIALARHFLLDEFVSRGIGQLSSIHEGPVARKMEA